MAAAGAGRMAVALLVAVAALGGGVAIGVVTGGGDDDVVGRAPVARDVDRSTTTPTTAPPSALDGLEGARFVGSFLAAAAPVNQVAVQVTAAGVVLELHLHLPDAGGCLYFDLEPSEPIAVVATGSALTATREITIVGGAAGHACEDGGPDDAGAIPAALFLMVQEDVGVTGTLTLSTTELRFTAREG